MNDLLTRFKWAVSTAPYECIGEGGGYWIAEKTNTPRTFYAPLDEHTGLYQNFIATPPTPNGVLGFASRYGLLGTARPDATKDEPSHWLEELDRWKREIQLMSLAESLRTAFETREFHKVQRYFVRKSGANCFAAEGITSFRLPTEGVTGPQLPARAAHDLFSSTGAALQKIVNKQLRGSVDSRLLWQKSKAGPSLALHRVPDSLLAAMWLQFARAVEGNRNYSQCEECRNWFEIDSSEGSRRHKRHCNSACRARAWRNARGK